VRTLSTLSSLQPHLPPAGRQRHRATNMPSDVEGTQPASRPVESMARARGQEAYVARALTDRPLVAPTAGDDRAEAHLRQAGRAGRRRRRLARGRPAIYFT
jgi:hypothetical protein